MRCRHCDEKMQWLYGGTKRYFNMEIVPYVEEWICFDCEFVMIRYIPHYKVEDIQIEFSIDHLGEQANG